MKGLMVVRRVGIREAECRVVWTYSVVDDHFVHILARPGGGLRAAQALQDFPDLRHEVMPGSRLRM